MSRSRLLLPLVLALLSSTGFPAAEPEPPPFTLKPLGHGVYAAIDVEGRAGANAGFIVGDDGVVVVDTFYRPAAAEALLAAIRAQTDRPIRFVINTHYHIDHVSGNRLFHDQGAVVLAQRNVRTWIHTENLKFFGQSPSPEQRSVVERLYAPDVGYDEGVRLYLGSQEILVRSYPGHTGGDSIVIVPAAGVVFCGDLFWRRSLPNMIDATAAAWIETLGAFQKLPSASSLAYVPGHGDVGNAPDVAAFRGYLADLRSLVEGAMKEEDEEKELVQAVVPRLEEAYGSWAFFEHFSGRDVQNMAAELRGTKTVPAPAAD
ncbi:MAG: MBL fold metallo-hydrolase [Acidobacteriota bacterium]|jgi:glyoxylase-like metal-dependent hydrolase (beta-lactamase superfamily II)